MDTPDRRASDPVLTELNAKMDTALVQLGRITRIVDGVPDEDRQGLRQQMQATAKWQVEAEKREAALRNKIDGMVILLRLIGAGMGAAGLVAGANFFQGLFS